MNKDVLLFAQKLTGAWSTTDKEMFWLFDTPDSSTYPYWFYHVKHKIFEEFIKKDMMLLNPNSDIFRLETSGVLGHSTYVLKFLDEDTLQVKTLINRKEETFIFNRVENVESLFEIAK